MYESISVGYPTHTVNILLGGPEKEFFSTVISALESDDDFCMSIHFISRI